MGFMLVFVDIVSHCDFSWLLYTQSILKIAHANTNYQVKVGVDGDGEDTGDNTSHLTMST